ncbi:hypothetical protein C8Q75DRAFT_733635 [Abortiporus biennis]|nr:hypothetical protein C8Q75DRAFT_733635 [Abortiporus biennis]
MLHNVELVSVHPVDVRQTMGAILLGSLISLFLSGAMSTQAIIYFRLHPGDRFTFKTLVGTVWFLDLLHSVMLCSANWYYFIEHFSDVDATFQIPWHALPLLNDKRVRYLKASLQAFITFLIHLTCCNPDYRIISFFSYRIYMLGQNKILILLIIAISTFRLGAAIVSTVEMNRLGNYADYVARFAWVYTVGLSTSAVVDILVTAALVYYLHRRRSGFTSMNDIITSLTIYTVENGMLTCKSYANAFLATLNARPSRGGVVSFSGPGPREIPSRPLLFREGIGRISLSRTIGSAHEVDFDPQASATKASLLSENSFFDKRWN